MRFSDNIRFLAACCLIFVIMLFCFNYIMANDYITLVPNPYALGKSYAVMEAKLASEYDLAFLLKKRNVVIVAETTDQSMVGIFDPTLKYYFASTKFIAPERFRYFSFDDYENSKRVGISIREVSPENNPLGVNYSELENKYNLKIINAFDYFSKISYYNREMEVVVNLFALDTREIRRLYIDSEYTYEIDEVVRELASQGFVRVKPYTYRSIWTSFAVISKLKKYVTFFSNGMYMAVFLLIYLCFVYTGSLRKFIAVSLTCGATWIGIARKTVVPLLFYGVISSAVSGCIAGFYLHILGKYVMDIGNFLEIMAFTVLILSISLIMGLFFQFIKGRVSNVN